MRVLHNGFKKYVLMARVCRIWKREASRMHHMHGSPDSLVSMWMHRLEKRGYMRSTSPSIAFTMNGLFLINSILSQILNRLDGGRVFRPLQASGVTGGEAVLKQQQQQSGIPSEDFNGETTPTEKDTAVAAAAAKAAGSRAAAAAAAGLPVNAQQQEQLQPPAPRFFAAMKKKEQPLPSFTSTSAEAEEFAAGSSPSSLLSPSSSSAVPPRQLQQTIEHLAKRAPAPLEPKAIRPVSKKEGSAWAEKTTKKEGRAFFKFDGEAKKTTEEAEDEDEEKERWKKVEVEVSVDDKMIPVPRRVGKGQENETEKTDRGALGAVGDFLWGSGGGKAQQGNKGNEVEEREEEGTEKERVWGSRSKNHDIVSKEKMEGERAAAAVAKEEVEASAVEMEGKEAQGREASGLENYTAVGSKRMKIGHSAIRVEEKGQQEEEETHESIDKKLRQQQGKGGEAEGKKPPSKKVFL